MMIEMRTLRPDELQKWLDFMSREIFPDDPREAVESMWHDDPVKDFTGIFVAVDAQENIVGSAKAACRDMLIGGQPVSTGIISGVGVRQDFRHQGVSRQLFAMCRHAMLERDVKLLHLYSNPDTLNFYRHMGYLSTPQQPGESFHRMYLLIAPFTIADACVSTTQQLINIL